MYCISLTSIIFVWCYISSQLFTKSTSASLSASAYRRLLMNYAIIRLISGNKCFVHFVCPININITIDSNTGILLFYIQFLRRGSRGRAENGCCTTTCPCPNARPTSCVPSPRGLHDPRDRARPLPNLCVIRVQQHFAASSLTAKLNLLISLNIYYASETTQLQEARGVVRAIRYNIMKGGMHNFENRSLFEFECTCRCTIIKAVPYINYHIIELGNNEEYIDILYSIVSQFIIELFNTSILYCYISLHVRIIACLFPAVNNFHCSNLTWEQHRYQ